jgi:hypothetical protein
MSAQTTKIPPASNDLEQSGTCLLGLENLQAITNTFRSSGVVPPATSTQPWQFH